MVGIFNIVASTDARCLFHQEVPLQKLTQRPLANVPARRASQKSWGNFAFWVEHHIQFKMYWLIQQVKVNLSYSTILIHQLRIISSKFMWLQSVTKLEQFPIIHIQLPSYHGIVERFVLTHFGYHGLLLDQSGRPSLGFARLQTPREGCESNWNLSLAHGVPSRERVHIPPEKKTIFKSALVVGNMLVPRRVLLIH